MYMKTLSVPVFLLSTFSLWTSDPPYVFPSDSAIDGSISPSCFQNLPTRNHPNHLLVPVLGLIHVTNKYLILRPGGRTLGPHRGTDNLELVGSMWESRATSESMLADYARLYGRS